MGRRKFAKNSQDVRHFKLVSRSQNDAFADDEDAPPLVLEPFVRPGDVRRTGLSEAELVQIPEEWAARHPEAFVDPDAPPRAPNQGLFELDEEDEDPEAALEGDCYFPKDGYNYEQHLRKVTKSGGAKASGSSAGGGGGVVLDAPTKVSDEVFKKQEASTVEEGELLRALEHADEYEEFDEGDLEELLPGGVLDQDLLLWGPTVREDANLPDLALFKEMHKARLAATAGGGEGEENAEGEIEVPALAAAGAKRPVAQTAPSSANAASGPAFEEFFAAEYGDDSDGACDDDDIEGEVDIDNCEELLDEYLEAKKAETEKLRSINEPIRGKLDDVPRVTEETKAIIAKYYSHIEEDGSETSSGEESEDESRTWDCETILSTLSNVSNRPGKIGKIKIIKKPVVPMGAVKEENKEAEKEDEEDDDVVELPDVITERPKNETAEEKKARKAGIKAMRKICRQMKKESKQTYKEEAAKLHHKNSKTGDVKETSRHFRL